MFEQWWQDIGRRYDHNIEDGPAYDKPKALAALAYEAGVAAGLARGANYFADDDTMPVKVTFANGRTVEIVDNRTPGVEHGVFLKVTRE